MRCCCSQNCIKIERAGKHLEKKVNAMGESGGPWGTTNVQVTPCHSEHSLVCRRSCLVTQCGNRARIKEQSKCTAYSLTSLGRHHWLFAESFQ